jgi:hypothetical protein
MRGDSFIRSLLAVGLVALAGAGCDLKSSLQDMQPPKGDTSTPGTDAGAGGASGGAASCVAEVGPNGVCKRCYDATGILVHEDCPPPPPPTPDPMCVNIQDGGPTSCKDAATWKKYGTDRCAQQSLTLTNLIPGTPCGANYQDVTYVCCGSGAGGATGAGGASGKGGAGGSDGTGGMGGASSGGGSGGSSGMCIKVVAGDSTSCQTYDALKLDGYNQCLQKNLPLTGADVGPACDGGYTSITFTCCASPGPSPSPPPKCVAIADGDPTSCKDAMSWQRTGSERCAQQSLTLTQVKYDVACDAGFSLVSYVCCGS